MTRRAPLQLARLCLAVLLALGPALNAGAQPSPAVRPPPPGRPQPSAASTWVDTPPLNESLKGQARADYDAARILFDDQDFSGTLVKFQRAFDQSNDLRLLWNMAVCEKNLRRYARVLRLVDRYWREGSTRMTERHRREVSDVLETVRMLISTVRVHVNVHGAQILVDELPAGVTPLDEPLMIDLGRHRIRVSKPGFQDQTVQQEFAGGSETTLNIALVEIPREGVLNIVTGDRATISIDGQLIAMGPWQGTLPAGPHTVRVTEPDMKPFRKEITVEHGQTRTIYIVLDEEERGIPAWVWVGAGVIAAGGLAVGGYMLLRSDPTPSQPEIGTFSPGVVRLSP